MSFIKKIIFQLSSDKFQCARCKLTFYNASNLRRHLHTTNCIKSTKIKCEFCKNYISPRDIIGHRTRCEKRMTKFAHHNVRLTPYICECGRNVTNKHICSKIQNLIDEINYKQYICYANPNEQKNFNMSIVNKIIHETISKTNIFYKQIAVALILAYRFLIRTTKGSLNANMSQSVFSLQRNHFILSKNYLNIKCIYGSSDYDRTFLLSDEEHTAFQIVINSPSVNSYLLASVRVPVTFLIDQLFKINLYAARRAAITSNFYKIISNNQTVENGLQHLTVLTHHKTFNEFDSAVNIKRYLDKDFSDVAGEMLLNKTKPPYNVEFNLPIFY